MYKKKIFNKLEKKYNTYQDKGAVGLLMKNCHNQLEKNKYFKKFNNDNRVLEIGAGSSPHLIYVSHNYGRYIFLENKKLQFTI